MSGLLIGAKRMEARGSFFLYKAVCDGLIIKMKFKHIILI